MNDDLSNYDLIQHLIRDRDRLLADLSMPRFILDRFRDGMPKPKYHRLWIRCPECGQRFWGTKETSARFDAYSMHWYQTHA